MAKGLVKSYPFFPGEKDLIQTGTAPGSKCPTAEAHSLGKKTASASSRGMMAHHVWKNSAELFETERNGLFPENHAATALKDGRTAAKSSILTAVRPVGDNPLKLMQGREVRSSAPGWELQEEQK